MSVENAPLTLVDGAFLCLKFEVLIIKCTFGVIGDCICLFEQSISFCLLPRTIHYIRITNTDDAKLLDQYLSCKLYRV